MSFFLLETTTMQNKVAMANTNLCIEINFRRNEFSATKISLVLRLTQQKFCHCGKVQKWSSKWTVFRQIPPFHFSLTNWTMLGKVVENIMIIYLNGSNIFPPISHCLFWLPNIDAMLFRPLIFLVSMSILYIPLCRPLFLSNVLVLILFGSNKGYSSCSPCHHFRKVSSGLFRFRLV
jgi:hypothetical protein